MQASQLKPLNVGADVHDKLCAMLRGSQFFGDFPEGELDLLAKHVVACTVDSGGTVFREGDRGGFMCLLIEGAADLSVKWRWSMASRVRRLASARRHRSGSC